MHRHPPAAAAVVLSAVLAAAACGGGSDSPAGGGRPSVVVTTTILGDVVSHLVGDSATIEVLMPPNTDPHDFQVSARQAAAMREADLLVVNGGGFEAGLDDAIRSAEADGATVFTALDHADPLPGSGGGDDVDPHFFTDPARMIGVAEALAAELADRVADLDTPAYRDRSAAYLDDLRTLDGEVAGTLAAVPPADRKLVTNHDVFAYFADRYGFTVVGTVIPSLSTSAEPSAGELDDLAATVEAEGVRAIFADTSSPEALAGALAGEVGEVEVVELYSESLGDPGSDGATYIEMIRTDADRIARALAP
ncbi:MAG TPA: metal ABC transporter substrate-binding protein [Acidimicrobiales bacterium]|nr:metal ABC transporter substrate-binding protein [Acidimicrobiales bacterium]